MHGVGNTNWFEIGIGVIQVCILPPYLINLFTKVMLRERHGRTRTALY